MEHGEYCLAPLSAEHGPDALNVGGLPGLEECIDNRINRIAARVGHELCAVRLKRKNGGQAGARARRFFVDVE